MKEFLLKGKKRWIAIVAALLLLGVGGVAAYFTSTDEATNQWTVGDVTIELLETEYDKVPAEERTNITPNQEFTKDPVVQNVGTNDAFVFLRVSIPKKEVRIADLNGQALEAEPRELFDYRVDERWTLVTEDTSASDKNTYVYAYGTEEACEALEAEAFAPSLFQDDEITFINVLEGQGLEGEKLEIPVEAFGIQTTDLGERKATHPQEVWEILMNQVETNQADKERIE